MFWPVAEAKGHPVETGGGGAGGIDFDDQRLGARRAVSDRLSHRVDHQIYRSRAVPVILYLCRSVFFDG